MRDNGDGRHGQQRRQRQTSMVVDIQDNRGGYGGGEDAGRKQKICETTEMANRIGRTATDWANIDRKKIPTKGRIIAPIN